MGFSASTAALGQSDSLLTYVPQSDLWGDAQLREKVETNAGWQFSDQDEQWITGYARELQGFCEALALDRAAALWGRVGA